MTAKQSLNIIEGLSKSEIQAVSGHKYILAVMPWCSFSNRLIKEISLTYKENNACIFLVDVDSDTDMALFLNAKCTPSLFHFHENKLLNRLLGEDSIKNYLNKTKLS